MGRLADRIKEERNNQNSSPLREAVRETDDYRKSLFRSINNDIKTGYEAEQREERATSAYDLALKMLQDDEDYRNSPLGLGGVNANQHSWKSTMQSIYANKMLKDSKETIDSKLGAGATDLLRTAVNGTAIDAQRNAYAQNRVSEINNLRRQFRSDDEFNDYLEGVAIGWTNGQYDPERSEFRKQRRDRQESKVNDITAELESIDRAYYDPTYEGYIGNADADQFAALEARRNELMDERERLEADINKYDRFQAPLDRYAGAGLEAKAEEYKRTHPDDPVTQYLMSQNEPNATKKGMLMPAKSGMQKMFEGGLGLDTEKHTVGNFQKHPEWNELTEEELNVYYGLAATNGEEYAARWLESMSNVLGMRRSEEYQKNLESVSTIERILLTAAQTPQRLASRSLAGAEDLANMFTGKGVNPYTGANLTMKQSEATIGAAAEGLDNDLKFNILGQTPGKIYQGIVSGIDSFAQMMIGQVFGSAHLGEIGMALGAGAAEAAELWEKGIGNDTVLARSILAGTFEALFEHMSIESFMKNFLKSPITGWADIAKKAGVQVLIEGSEEGFTDGANFLSDLIHLRSQSEWTEMFNKYKAQGYSDGQAIVQSLLEEGSNLVDSFMGGVYGALLSSGGGAMTQTWQNRNTGSQIISEGAAETLRKTAEELAGAEGLGEQYAQAISKTAEKVGKKATPSRVGYMYNAVENAINEGFGDNAEAAVKAGAKVLKSLEKSTDIRTAETSDGQTVSIDENNPIARFEDGKAILNTSNGEMSVDDLSFADDSARLAYDNVNTYDVETANAVLNNYQSGDIARYLAGMREGIELHGKMNVPSEAVSYYSTLSEENQRYAKTLGQTMRQTIVDKAVQAAKTGTVTEFKPTSDMTLVGEAKRKGAAGTKGTFYTLGDVSENLPNYKENRDFTGAAAFMTGLPVVAYNSETVQDEQLKNANGKYVWKNGAIYVDFNAGPVNGKKGLVAFALSHELTHFAEQWSPEDYKTYADWLVSTYSSKGGSMEALVKARMASEGTDYEEAYHDVIADFSERMLLDSDVLEKLEALREKDKTVWQKIVDKIKTLVNRIIGAYGDENQTYESNAIRDLLNSEELQKMKELWSTAVVEGAKNRAAAVERTETRQANENNAEIPTVTKFSMKSPVEQTKNLIAVHNLSVSELEKSLDLGGLPMPSIAIIRAGQGHSEYGDVSIVFPKDAIDPQRNKDNKIYSGDAWTPTFPKIEYKINEKVESKIRKKYYDLYYKYGREAVDALYPWGNYAEDQLNREGGEKAVFERYADNTDMMNVFLIDTTGKRIEPVIVTKTKEMDDDLKKESAFLFDKLGQDLVDELEMSAESSSIAGVRKYLDKHGEQYDEYLKDMYSKVYNLSQQEAENIVDNMSKQDRYIKLGNVLRFRKNEGVQVFTETDIKATEKAIRDATNKEEYNQWLKELFSGIEEKKGIYNNRERYTPSGNLRSFEALHYEITLDNIIREMKSHENAETMFGGNAVWGAAAKLFKSIDEVKADAGRIYKADYEEYKKIKEKYVERLSSLSSEVLGDSLENKDTFDRFTLLDSAAGAIAEAIKGKRTVDSVMRSLREYKYLKNVNEDVARKIIDLADDIASMPTEYFEAKPERAVMFDEAATVIVPDTTSEETKQRVRDLGSTITEYKAGDEKSRLEALNNVEGVRFSRKVTPAENARYMELAKDPVKNEAELSRMVEAAAVEWGALTDKNGNPKKLYHGTSNGEFTVFDKNKAGDNYHGWGRLGKGFYFASKASDAKVWGEKSKGGNTPRVLTVYLDLGNSIDVYEKTPQDLMDYIHDKYAVPEKWDSEGYTLMSAVKEHMSKAAYRAIDFLQNERHEDVREVLQSLGYDGLYAGDGTEYVVYDPSQIKLADPVTYDDNGNVIPLEERFNPRNEDIRYSRKVAGETVYNNRVILNEDTVDKYLRMYASKDTAKYAQAYITYIDPDTFIRLTTATAEGRQFIEDQTSDLDTEKLANASTAQPMFLDIDHTTGKVEQHEGRHRMNALRRAGVNKVPVLLFDFSNKYDKVTIPSLTLYGQDGWGGRANYAYATVYDVMPLSYENRDEIVKRFSEKTGTEKVAEKYGRETVQYSRKQARSYSTRAVVERALKTLPEGAEKKALTEYKQTLDSYDAERMAYNAAVQAGDQDNITRAKNNMKTLSAKLERMENGKSLQNIAAVRDVKALNEDAKDLREMLRAQATETGGTVASKASAKLAADTLAERYNITKGKGELADLISELYTEVMTGVNNGAYNREQVLDMARSVSEWIDEKQSEERRKNRQEDPEVKDVLNYIKGSRVRINENQKGDIRSRYDGKLIKWMGKLSGYVRVANNATMTLDDLWGDLSKQYPHIFDATISDADEGIMLADIISDLKSRRYIEEEEYDPTREEHEDYIRDISEEVVNALWEVKPQLTIADRYAKKIESLRERHKERMRETRRTFEQTIREQREASWQRGKEVAEARQKRRELRTRIKALMTNLSNRLVNPKVGKYVPMNLQQPVAEVLSMIDTDTGRSDRASAKLSALYFAYENIKNDPKYAEYRNVYDPAVSEMMRRVTTAVTEMEEVNAKYGRAGIYSREVEKGKSTGTVDTQLSVRLLDNLYEALKQFDTVIKDSVNVHGLGSALDETLSTHEVGQKLIEEVRTENKKKSNLRKALLRGIHLTPDSFFNRLAGHKKDSMWSRVYKMIDNAQTKQLRIEMESNAIFREILKDKKYLRDITNTKKTYDVGLKDVNGNPVLLTKDMILTLYKHLQNEDNTRHIIVGGLNLPNLASYYKNQENAYNGEERMPGFVGEELAAKYKQIEEESAALDDAWEVASINNDYEALARLEEKMNAMREEADAIIRKGEKQARELLKNIEEQLDDKDRKFIEMSNEYFDEYSKNVLNEATMAMYGFEKAKVKNYFPIHVDSAFLKSSFDEIKKDFSLENSGFMKDRQKGASNPLYLEGFTTAVNQQIEKVARYAGLAPALKEFEKLYGVSEGGVTYNDSVKKAILNVFGRAGTDYIDKLVADLNGNSRQKVQPWERFFQKARGRFAQGVLAVNAGVALKQRVSYLAAASELDYKSLSKALLIPEKGSFIFQGKQRRQNADELIAKWLPQLWKRSEGFIDVAMGEVRNVNQLRNRVNSKLNFLLGWIQASDISTVRRLWYASEYYVRDHNKNLTPESDEYYRAVAEKYRDVIEKTQPNYTTLQRPAILRTNSEFIKSLTMFMTQRLQNFNIVYDSVLTANKYARDKKNGRNGVTEEDVHEARMRAYRAVSSQLGAAVGMAAINFLSGVVLFGRGKKWKDEDGEVTANSVLLGMLDDFLSSLCSNVVGGGEIYGIISSIVKGEKWKDGFSIGGLDTIEDAITSFSDALVKVRNGKELTSADWVKIGGNVCTMFGIPGANAYKLARGLKNNLEGTIRGMEVDGELWELGATPDRTDDQNGRRMLNAFLEGNDEKFESLEAEFGSKSKAEKAFIDALYEANRSGKITDDQVSDALEYIDYDDFDIGKVGKKWEGKDLSAREEELYDEWKRGMSFDDVVKTLADEGHELSKWDQHVLLGEWTAKKETGAKSNFVWSEELDEALEGYMRDTSTGSNMKSVIKQYREWGCEDSKLDDRVGYLFRDKYKAAYRESKTKAATIRGRIIVMLMECGRTEKKANDLVGQWEDAAKK